MGIEIAIVAAVWGFSALVLHAMVSLAGPR